MFKQPKKFNINKNTKGIVYIVGGSLVVGRMFEKEGYDVISSHWVNCDPDFVVFTGGQDIHPKWYNEVLLRETTPAEQRDREEIAFIQRWWNKRKIGICRGGQLLNVQSGGSMFQDVNNHNRDHEIIDLLISKEPIKVTSTHHQMMIPGEDGLVIGIAFEATKYLSASSRENPLFDTEVVWYDKTNSLCFQPHPEYSGAIGKNTREYFFELINYIWR